MPDFLTNVVTTYLGQRKVIEPRRPARFEPLDTLGVDPVLNVASGLDEVVNVDEGVPDPAEKAVDSAPDASLSQGRSPEQPTPNDHTVPFASSRPQSPLVGDPQTEQPLLDPSFDRQPRQASSAPPDTTSQPLPDSGTSGSLLPREGGRREGPPGQPEIGVTGTTTTQPSIRPNHVHPRVIAEPVEPDPLTTPPAHPPRPVMQGPLQPPRLNDLQPHLPGEVDSAGRSSMDAPEPAHAPDQAPPARAQQIAPGRDENTQSPSRPIRPPGYFDEPTPTLIPAAPMRLSAVESLNADHDRGSRRGSGPPTIKVAIGRIEVRAERAPTPPHLAPQVTTRQRYQPKLSLTDYLKKRNEGGG